MYIAHHTSLRDSSKRDANGTMKDQIKVNFLGWYQSIANTSPDINPCI